MYRAREPHAVQHPLTHEYVVPSPTEEYDDDDPVVEAYPWLFTKVESASAEPGKKRSRRSTPAQLDA